MDPGDPLSIGQRRQHLITQRLENVCVAFGGHIEAQGDQVGAISYAGGVVHVTD
ncbi:hypothetical protein D3C79_1107450 [compost metagenome]